VITFSRGRMDYLIAGIAALFLFGYLIYALLRPEQF
jgi:K+-transporting ATPase KdpF subunit